MWAMWSTEDTGKGRAGEEEGKHEKKVRKRRVTEGLIQMGRREGQRREFYVSEPETAEMKGFSSKDRMQPSVTQNTIKYFNSSLQLRTDKLNINRQ